MARGKDTWAGQITGTGVALDGSVVVDVMAEHAGTSHPVRIKLSREDAQMLAGRLVLNAIRTSSLTTEKTHNELKEIAS